MNEWAPEFYLEKWFKQIRRHIIHSNLYRIRSVQFTPKGGFKHGWPGHEKNAMTGHFLLFLPNDEGHIRMFGIFQKMKVRIRSCLWNYGPVRWDGMTDYAILNVHCTFIIVCLLKCRTNTVRQKLNQFMCLPHELIRRIHKNSTPLFHPLELTSRFFISGQTEVNT